ncbi:hypothetical protein CPter91_4024 [Collimonas pratensis]|uniref:Uncharacterized protein n=1 Tax=Collimonas pratensis TaxID=279113 RepID=A0A127Q8J7_9BURK|nr:hypothetical protein CPter91_4024 [Collimonas pratensis]
MTAPRHSKSVEMVAYKQLDSVMVDGLNIYRDSHNRNIPREKS